MVYRKSPWKRKRACVPIVTTMANDHSPRRRDIAAMQRAISGTDRPTDEKGRRDLSGESKRVNMMDVHICGHPSVRKVYA